MGQKVHPIGFRLTVTKDWDSKWFSKEDYTKFLLSDIEIKKIIRKEQRAAGISRITIERPMPNKLRVYIHAARPGIIVGKKCSDLEILRRKIEGIVGHDVVINVLEVRRVDMVASIIAENVAIQLEKRVNFRRAMKKAVTAAMRAGAKGIKIACSGRLGGAEMARTEWYREGRVPLHTLRADIDYAVAEARTIYGVIGVKVWVYKGEMVEEEEEE